MERAGKSHLRNPPPSQPPPPPPPPPHFPLPNISFRITRKGTIVSESAAVRNDRSQKLAELLPTLPPVVDQAFAEALADLMVDQKKKVRATS